jgi:hypothetical protein
MNQHTPRGRTAPRFLAAVTVALVVAAVPTASAQQRGGRGGQPQESRQAKANAPIDLTGYWVPVITEDWRWRMLTPPRGDYASVPVSNEGRRLADTWDLAKDEASGNACKPFGIGNIMRMPGRLHITWQDDDALKLEFDAGTQTRVLHFTGAAPAGAEPTWQGYSVAAWEVAGQQVNLDRNGIPVAAGDIATGGSGGAAAGGDGRRGAGGGRGGAPRGGALKVVTTNMRDGYLRKNGVPYSASAILTEYWDLGSESNGDRWITITSVVDDPRYLRMPFVAALQFKREADGAKWDPMPCSAR